MSSLTWRISEFEVRQLSSSKVTEFRVYVNAAMQVPLSGCFWGNGNVDKLDKIGKSSFYVI